MAEEATAATEEEGEGAEAGGAGAGAVPTDDMVKGVIDIAVTGEKEEATAADTGVMTPETRVMVGESGDTADLAIAAASEGADGTTLIPECSERA